MAVAALALFLVGPWSWSPAAGQTGSSVCGGANQPCAGTPFAQAEGAPAATTAASDGAAPSPLARTGIDTDLVLLASVAALALGCIVLLYVEARESALRLRYEAARPRSWS